MSRSPSAAQLHDALPNNIGYQFRREGGDVERAFAEAEVVVRRRLTNNRVAPAPLEGRVVLSEFDSVSGRLVNTNRRSLWRSSSPRASRSPALKNVPLLAVQLSWSIF